MIKREELIGHWNEVKGRLQEHWGQLTDDDLQRAKGSADELVSVVQQKTGATRKEVERFLDGLLGGTSKEQLGEAAQHYAEAAQELAGDAAQYMKDSYRRVTERSGDYSAQLNQSVRSRPAESLAIAFGLGIVAGALFFMGKRR